MRSFYARVQRDPVLAPVFARVIDGDWEPHLKRMCDFWSAVLLTSGRYHGNPMAAHGRLAELTPGHFEHWLTLFRLTAREVLSPGWADNAIGRAERIAESLQRGLFYDPARADPSHCATATATAPVRVDRPGTSVG